MENAQFSILTLPQSISENVLTVRFLLIPRNFSPLIGRDVDTTGGNSASVVFADDPLTLIPTLIPSLDSYPNDMASMANNISFTEINAGLSVQARQIFESLATEFNIKDSPDASDLAPMGRQIRIRKYLPHSYRQAVDYIRKNEWTVLDDSYRCAFHQGGDVAPIQEQSNEVSWGEVYAFILRQPELARRVGFIREYEVTLPSEDTFLAEGGWLFANLLFEPQGNPITPTFEMSRRYAARLPQLASLEDLDRIIFAVNQFPVLETDGEEYEGLGDLLIESSRYDDGFAKVVHCFQPVSIEPIREETDNALPTHDYGLRIAWDDEQVLTWLNRQMSALVGSLDTPLGVFAYRVDIASDPFPQGQEDIWHSLCLVRVKDDRQIGLEPELTVLEANTEIEFGVEVHPVRLNPVDEDSFWLPMYFTQWTGNSLVISDENSVRIHQLDLLANNANVTEQIPTINYETVSGFPALRYGSAYQFRIRLMDLTGGGPTSDDMPLTAGPTPVGHCDFKRYVIPHMVRVLPDAGGNDPLQSGGRFDGDNLQITRPFLGYPSVVFTGQYDNPIERLIASGEPISAEERSEVGIPDPDVDGIEILVEVKSLTMDNGLSLSGTDAYLPLYRTERDFPERNSDDDYALPLTLEFVYQDAHQLEYELDTASTGDLQTDESQLILPTGRDIRLTIWPRCRMQDDAGNELENYYGDERILRGEPLQLLMHRASANEHDLFSNINDAEVVRGIYMQPDPVPIAYPQTSPAASFITTGQANPLPDNTLQRLAKALDLENQDRSFYAEAGTQIQFGLSEQIRHNLGPDHATFTISAREDVLNQWIIPLDLILNRDWTWSSLQRVHVFREHRFSSEAWSDRILVGTVEIRQTDSTQTLKNPDRSSVRLLFLDAIDPKPKTEAFPDSIDVRYSIEPAFQERFQPGDFDESIELPELHLPVTTPPSQIPKIASAGIALSPYERNENYSESNTRQRSLWLEFTEPPSNSNDTYFIRFLAYAPDPWLSRLKADDFTAKQEPPLPIDPELVRVIAPDFPDDQAGLTAMQELMPADSSDRHYIVPLPAGMHTSSPELFGFFTYEIRLGHREIWSTAQGRFGRRIRATGIQHPAPSLHCVTTASSDGVWVSAPYAQAVLDGKDISARPPRTSIRAILYAQVKMVDGNDYRNVLLDDRLLCPEVKIKGNDSTFTTTISEVVAELDIEDPIIVNPQPIPEITPVTNRLRGFTYWSYHQIQTILSRLGLALDSPLSVVCVELMPYFTERSEQAELDNNEESIQKIALSQIQKQFDSINELYPPPHHVLEPGERDQVIERAPPPPRSEPDSFDNRPLTDDLGKFRIYRTSRLTKVELKCSAEVV